MAASDPSVQAIIPSLQIAAPAAAQPATPARHINFSFKDLLDIVNPLQHIPIVSTIYRAVTGDTIKPFDKVAGDTLYGGVIGFVSSMADTIFQAITGKDFGDTVLSLITGDHGSKPVAVASTSSSSPSDGSTASAGTPAQSDASATTFAAASVVPDANVAGPDMSALWTSATRNGIDPSLAVRAAKAYQRAVTLSVQPLAPAHALALPPLS